MRSMYVRIVKLLIKDNSFEKFAKSALVIDIKRKLSCITIGVKKSFILLSLFKQHSIIRSLISVVLAYLDSIGHSEAFRALNESFETYSHTDKHICLPYFIQFVLNFEKVVNRMSGGP